MVKSGEGGKGLRFFRGRYKNAGRTKPAARGRLARGWNRDEGTGGFHVSRRSGGWMEGRWGPNHNQVERRKEGRKGVDGTAPKDAPEEEVCGGTAPPPQDSSSSTLTHPANEWHRTRGCIYQREGCDEMGL